MATPEELELERKKLALEEEKFRSAHGLAVKKFELEQGKQGESWFLKLTKNPMAIVSLVAAALSYWQYRNTEATRQQEAGLARAKAEAEDDRQWRVALIEFLEHQRADLFSADVAKKQQAIAMLEASFPSKYAVAVLNKLQLVQGGGEAASAKQLVDELLAPLVKELDASKAAFDKLQPNDTEHEQAMRQANLNARDLLVEKAALIPSQLRQEALQLVEHYDAWFAEYERVRGANMAAQQVPYVFAGPRGVPFPTNAEQKFREALKEQRKLLGP